MVLGTKFQNLREGELGLRQGWKRKVFKNSDVSSNMAKLHCSCKKRDFQEIVSFGLKKYKKQSLADAVILLLNSINMLHFSVNNLITQLTLEV